jgi:ATP-dependent protease Clp ATPase subunit
MKNVRRFLRCSFCSANARKCEWLIEGPEGVYICASCVAVCVELVDGARKEAEDRKQAVSAGAPAVDPIASVTPEGQKDTEPEEDARVDRKADAER